MISNESIQRYLSGQSDRDTAKELENKLLEDTGLLERFIGACEESLISAPDDLAVSVMQAVLKPPAHIVSLPGRRLRAAMCFCGAAMVILCTAIGPNRLTDMFTGGFVEKFNQFLSAISAFKM